MATLVLKMSVSLDGYVAPLDGSTDWVAAGRSDDGAKWSLETVRNAAAHLMGAATYARWATFWPSASGPFAKPMNTIPKVVFSNSLASADWDETTIATGDLAESITRLKRERPEGYLLAQGGARFARSLVATGLIDEYRLVVHPVVLVRASSSSPRRSPSSRRVPPSSAAGPSRTSSRRTRDQADRQRGSGLDGEGLRYQSRPAPTPTRAPKPSGDVKIHQIDHEDLPALTSGFTDN